MSEPPNTPPPAGTPGQGATGRGIRIALAFSLAANLLIAGLVVGAFLGRHGDEGDPTLRALGLAPFVLALGRDGRDDLRNRVARDLPRLREERTHIGRGLRQVRRALLAEPFDRAEAAAALSRSREAATALQALGHGALLDSFEAMPAPERAVVAERLGRTMRWMARRAEEARP